jgi:hypothetical protein
LFAVIGLVAISGCKAEWSIHKAPDGYAIIRDGILTAPRNIPPIHNELEFAIIGVDGGPVERERVPPFVDEPPGVLVVTGTHRLRSIVGPPWRGPGYHSKDITFQVTVENRKVYFLEGDKDGMPILVEEHPNN